MEQASRILLTNLLKIRTIIYQKKRHRVEDDKKISSKGPFSSFSGAFSSLLWSSIFMPTWTKSDNSTTSGHAEEDHVIWLKAPEQTLNWDCFIKRCKVDYVCFCERVKRINDRPRIARFQVHATEISSEQNLFMVFWSDNSERFAIWQLPPYVQANSPVLLLSIYFKPD